MGRRPALGCVGLRPCMHAHMCYVCARVPVCRAFLLGAMRNFYLFGAVLRSWPSPHSFS